MAFLAQLGGMALGGAGSASSALAEKKAGIDAQVAAEGEASQLEQNADRTVAVGSFNTKRIADKVKQILGTQRAQAAQGNNDTTYGSTTDIAGETIKQAGMDELLTMANAEDSASKARYQAKIDRISGTTSNTLAQSRADATTLTGVSTLLQSGGNWLQKYGGSSKPSTSVSG